MTLAKSHREHWVRSEADLALLRTQDLSIDSVLAALARTGRLLLSLDVGGGKTHLLRELVRRHREAPIYDLVVYLTSQHRVLDEQPFVREHRALSNEERLIHDVALVSGRPANDCGALHDEWKAYERAGCSDIGRAQLCQARCPRRETCAWPDRMSKDRLRGKRVIAALQPSLMVMPTFIKKLVQRTGARRALVLLDEATIVDATFQRTITYEQLERSRAVFAAVAREDDDRRLRKWIDLHDQLLQVHAGSLDGVRLPPMIYPPQLAALQRKGWDMYSRRFRFLGFDLPALCAARRWRVEQGVCYVARPHLDDSDYIVAAAGVPLDLVRHRFAEPRIEQFAQDVRLLHQDTRVYNINSTIGSASYHEKNAPQILYAAAQFIVKLAAEGKRVVVVTKKRFVGLDSAGLEKHLGALSGQPYRVIHNAKNEDIPDPMTIPLVTYGAQGINTYEHFDAVIALCSYNAREDVIAEHVNDVHTPSEQVSVARVIEGDETRFGALGYWARRQGFDELARSYQHQHEAAVAEQALGRVRFTIHPRLVVFMQRSHPRFPLVAEFQNLEEFRAHFGLSTQRTQHALDRREEIVVLHRAGISAREIAQRLGIDKSTVCRHLRAAGANG